MKIERAWMAVGVALLPAFAWAGNSPVPAPLAGAFGPAGLAAAGVGYIAYRVFKNRNK